MNKDRLKVLLISPLPPPAGGIASWTVNILDYYNKGEHSIDLLHFNTGGGARRNTDLRLLSRFYYGARGLFKYLNKIKDIINRKNIDLIHITSSASFGLIRDILLLNKIKRTGVKSCIHFRFGRIPTLAKLNNWEWKLLKKTCRSATKVIVIDMKSYNTLREEGFENILYLPNPLSEKIRLIVENNIVERKNNEILFVGHITKNKGVYELVEACAKITKKIKLKLIGDYEEATYKELKRISLNKGDSNWIKFTGNKEVEYILSSMQKCTIFALPSYTEGFPNVILESMAAAAPIIATDVGAISDMLNIGGDRFCGKSIIPQSVGELFSAIDELLDDKENSLLMGERAKERVLSEYSMEIVFKNLIKIWRNI